MQITFNFKRAIFYNIHICKKANNYFSRSFCVLINITAYYVMPCQVAYVGVRNINNSLTCLDVSKRNVQQMKIKYSDKDSLIARK